VNEKGKKRFRTRRQRGAGVRDCSVCAWPLREGGRKRGGGTRATTTDSKKLQLATTHGEIAHQLKSQLGGFGKGRRQKKKGEAVLRQREDGRCTLPISLGQTEKEETRKGERGKEGKHVGP